MRPTSAPFAGDAASLVNATGLELLAAALMVAPPSDRTMRLRIALFSDPLVWERLFATASERRMMPALAMRLRERGLVPPRPRSGKGPTPASVLEAQCADYLAIRTRQAAALADIVAILNRLDIEPILLKGAHCLWCDTDPWRTMRDLDILVAGARARDAEAALGTEGYCPAPDAAHRPNRHHLDLLFREDLPGWVEVHRRAGNPYAEQFIRTPEIVERSAVTRRGAGRACILPASVRIWHGLVHHHFGHSGFARGTIDLKGLFEFAMAVSSLPAEEVTALVALASRNAAALAAFDVWIAAAVDLFEMPLPANVPLSADAAAAWEKMRRRKPGTTGWTEIPRLP